MNKVLENLEKESLRIRRDKGALSAFCAFALAEIRKIGKNKGNRETTEEETITAIKKMIDTNNSNIAISASDYTIQKLTSENNLLKSVLPEMVSELDLILFLRSLDTPEKLNKSHYLKMVKEKYGVLVDMKLAVKLVETTLGV
jgi:hypothetical protein